MYSRGGHDWQLIGSRQEPLFSTCGPSELSVKLHDLKVHKHEIILNFYFTPKSNPYTVCPWSLYEKTSILSLRFMQNFDVRTFLR
jgi:hypothetical protein